MFPIISGIFMVLHGVVHLLYFGQSARLFELTPGLTWPDGSWLFARWLGVHAVRNLAGALLILSALIFIAGGIGLFTKQIWWRSVIISASIVSSITFIIFWDGVLKALDNKGFVGILINLAILAVVLIRKNLV